MANIANAQSCLPNGIDFEEQSEIDNFATNYPGCTIIEGDVHIEEDITNLIGLNQITTIQGNLRINETSGLANLEGLNNLTTVGGDLTMIDNDIMTSTARSNNLITIGGRLHLVENHLVPPAFEFNNLTTIGGDLLVVWNQGIVDFSGMNNLQSITGTLNLEDNNALIDLTGLENLTTIIEGLRLLFSDNISSLNGLNNLSSLNFINLEDLPSLVSLEGLESLTSIEELEIEKTAITNLDGLENLTTAGALFSITENDSLLNLSGLENLQAINGHLIINNNPQLNDLSGLSSLNFFSLTGVDIEGNYSLSVCNNPYSICNYISLMPDNTDIEFNATGCHDLAAILESCATLQNNIVRYPIFHDINENGILDNDEQYYEDGCVLIEGSSATTICGNNLTGGLIYLPDGTYTFTFDTALNPGWSLTTSPASYTVVVNGSTPVDTLFFGMIPDVITSNVGAFTSSHIFRCNEYVTFTNTVDNLGSSIATGTFWLQADENILNTSYLDDPDHFIPPSTYGWDFSNLHPSFDIQKEISLQIPGPDDLPIGALLHFSSWVDYSDTNGTQLSDTFHFHIKNEYQIPNNLFLSELLAFSVVG